MNRKGIAAKGLEPTVCAKIAFELKRLITK
jgi:hypothetical protein